MKASEAFVWNMFVWQNIIIGKIAGILGMVSILVTISCIKNERIFIRQNSECKQNDNGESSSSLKHLFRFKKSATATSDAK